MAIIKPCFQSVFVLSSSCRKPSCPTSREMRSRAGQASFSWVLTLCIFLCYLCSHPVDSVLEDADYWEEFGRARIQDALRAVRNEGVAKNVILFVGDGMGISTVTAGRIFKGQQHGHNGEEGLLTFEKFTNVGLIKTYNVDRQVPDSAGTATAMFSGVKANYYTVGFDSTVRFNVCRPDVEAKARVPSIITWAMEAGKATGLVTTTRITHATPAAAYAHIAHRDWECDTKIPESERAYGCKDIARQLVEDEPGKSINVVLGGGEQTLRAYLNTTSVCHRGDGKDLVHTWRKNQVDKGRSYRFVDNKKGLMETDPTNVDYLLGLFAPSHIPYDKDRDLSPTGTGQPSLEEMTTKALEVLSRNKQGYVLIVEGGRIDHAHHDNLAQIALEEVVAFDKAIEKALSMTDAKDTLVIVTADHSHSFTMNGYPKRGSPIEGLSDVTPEGYSYQTLSYINGPGYTHHRLPAMLSLNKNSTSTLDTWLNLNATKSNRTTPHHAGFWMDWGTHGGEDVAAYASGPMAHLFQGVHEQTHVAFTIGYSACIGPYAKACRAFEPAKKPPRSSAPHFRSVTLLTSALLLISSLLLN